MFVPVWGILAGLLGLVALAGAALLRMRAVRRSALLFKAVAEGASDGLVLMERDSRVIWTNRAYSRIMGYEHGTLTGRYPLEYALPPRLALPPEQIRAFRFDETDERFGTLTQVENVRKDGTEFIHEFSHAAIHVGGAPRFLLAGRDITERVAREKALVAAQDRLKAQSLTDPLTGLANRLCMQTCLDNLICKQAPFAVLQIDVNGMKRVNDSFGHQAGDALLVHIASAFGGFAGKDWVCTRTGGDEFVILLPGIEKLEDAVDIGHRLSGEASRPLYWKAAKLTANIGIGVAVWDRSISSSDDLLNRSDVALYEAKARHDTCVVGYDEQLARDYAENQALERDVAVAVQEGQFTFFFQPIINIETCRVEKFEMLVRWKHVERGLMSPNDFLPLISQLGLTDPFDRFVISSAEKALCRLDRAGLHDSGLSVNLSAEALASVDMTDLLVWLAESGRIDSSRISLEVLESTALGLADGDLPIRLLTRLKSAGYKVLLDDFGMGYAGLAHLAQLPTNGLKIDRGLTSAVDSEATSRSIVVALVRLATELGLDVIAEGVENTAQMEIVRGAGCSVFQGYAVCRPMPLKRAIAWAIHDQTRATGTKG